MRIAVTGAGGFIGERVINEINSRKNVSAIGLTRQQPEAMPGTCSWLTTDYSRESLAEALQDVDAVIHLAAIRGTGGVMGDYHENEILTERILLAMGDAGVKRMVFASSIAVYSDVERIPWTEDMPLTPKTLYGISKAACEHIIAYYAKQSGLDYTILRIAQVLGNGEKRRGMMNVFVDTARAGGEITVQGRSVAARQYIYVDDLARALVETALLPAGQSVTLNIGMPKAYTNLAIAKCCNMVYDNPTPVNYRDDYPETIEPSCMAIDRLREVLDFEPMALDAALRRL